MQISNIKVDEKDDDITLYTASINIDGIICIQNLKINLYAEEMIVEWPKNVNPVNDKVKEYIVHCGLILRPVVILQSYVEDMLSIE